RLFLTAFSRRTYGSQPVSVDTEAAEEPAHPSWTSGIIEPAGYDQPVAVAVRCAVRCEFRDPAVVRRVGQTVVHQPLRGAECRGADRRDRHERPEPPVLPLTGLDAVGVAEAQ